MTTLIPITWLQLIQFSFYHPPEITLGRSEAVNSLYQEYSQNLKKTGIAVYDNLKHRYFSGENKGYVITKNGFPYYLEGSIQHHLIWVDPQYFGPNKLNLSDHDSVRQIIRNKFFADVSEADMDRNCVYYQNIERLRSVKCMPHVHVFIKRKNRK
jgi:hypothetical protein